ncbi:piezo-type mechanosensitive ion channel component isoform X1 [Bactrocera dorsalis]|uniref:Piezo-type mechanosensitive ion channel component isoform X1 n=1 Tax=Bactrocera dorsalis TaxID=27457 RepID=A0ABM3J7P7_BACDO|nr:piezo-type mechanosensitive ion channel component isoform X1 [Bactrocera dorsalis]XP_049305308.1 piezo-type mechanosensitive ion channel component isoform X1 [Bactrocera dorsalis]
MAVSYACLAVQYVVVPTVLVLAALFRPAGISFVYLLMFFITPFIPIANSRNFKSSVGPFYIILIALCSLLLLCHIVLQVTIIAMKIESIFAMCSFTQQLLRHIGFINLQDLHPIAAAEWHMPDVVVFITVVISFIVIKKLSQKPPPITLQLETGEIIPIRSSTDSDNTDDEAFFDGLIRISPLFCLAMLFVIAVLRPSAPAGFYFLIFLLSGSYWATYNSLRRGFSVLLRFLMLVIALHSVCIVAYQTPWAQYYLSSDNLIARLIGLEPLVLSSCDRDIRVMSYNLKYSFDSFILPILMLLTYFVLALTAKCLSNPNVTAKPKPVIAQLENGSKLARQISRITTHSSRGSKKDSWKRAQRLTVSLRRDQRPKTTIEPTETTPLVKRLRKSDARDASSDEATMDLQDSNSPDVFTNTICDQICYGFISIGQFIYQNSYIFTNISMMTWSIVYHSWLTFVLLLWANILWMIPNQRKAMMRSSPFIVCYAELLLIAQYVYGMNLKNDELPSKVETAGINLQQIGLERPQEHGTHPCVPLIVKTLFLLMFWVTSRQFFQEKAEEKLIKRRAPVVMPMETIDSETSVESPNKHTSKFLKKIGDIVKNLLVRLWIWMLVLVIFLCAMTGKFMTGFRICYMALFLFFLLVFQSSSKVWVKVMYGFWLFIIFYAMSMLILIYTYQFDKFEQYWYEYLNISQTLQNDIGLERYKTKDLFLHLVSPTLIVVLTVIQVHYFHRRFIESLHQRKPSLIPDMVYNREMGKPPKTEPRGSNEAAKLLVSSLKRIRKITKHYFIVSKKLFWRFLELHIIKAVYITAFVCAVSQVCVIHVVFVALCVLGCITRSSIQIFISRIISFVVSIIILSKMIYQIGYLTHEDYDVRCQNEDTIHGNSALWFGLQKADDTTNGLIGLIKMYIIYMIVVTLHAVVSLRQFQMRAMADNADKAEAKVLFPATDRAKAETNLKSMIQYLFNYGFYKFGQEISLIMLVTTIAYRQDVVAIFYVIWLAVLLMFSRARRSSVWGIFQVFIALSIFLQYLVLLGLPPSLCIDYPWENSRFSAPIQGWLLLPGGMHYDHTKKLIFDFILLLFVTRQKRIFRIELRYGDQYAGGSNRNVVKDIENLGRVAFINPTNDFLSHVRNYLDIFMYAVLCGFFWVTLATVFLAGTNMSDFLTLGYLIGAFIFLWEGSDFYLRPIQQIIGRWRWLLAYNVFNIVVKTCLEMAGCLFLKDLTKHCCWLVHLLGVSCHFPTEPIMNDPLSKDDSDCPEINKSSMLMWDTICFAFLILQMRIFKSHYFCHLIIDTKANSILATRGADIIEDLRQKQIEHRQQHENEILVKIKRKMERIRATQQKMLKPIDKPTHFDEHGAPSKPHKRKEIKLHGPDAPDAPVGTVVVEQLRLPHKKAVRAGDYYMFEDVDDKFELDVIDDEQDFLSEQESEKKLQRRKTVIHVWKDIQTAEFRRQVYMRQRSYASAPGSRIGIKIDEELENEDAQEAGARTSTLSEPHDYTVPPRSASGFFTDIKRKSESEPSTSKEAKEATEMEEKKKKGDVVDSEESEDDLEANPIVRLLEGFLVSVTIGLHRLSRNYRYVNKIMSNEKRLLKETHSVNLVYATDSSVYVDIKSLSPNAENAQLAGSIGSASIDTQNETNTRPLPHSITNVTDLNTITSDTSPPSPLESHINNTQEQQQLEQTADPHAIIDMSVDTVDMRNDSYDEDGTSMQKSHNSVDLPKICIKAPSFDCSNNYVGMLSKQWSYEKMDSHSLVMLEEDFTAREHNIIIEFLISLWYALLSNTDIICYLVVFINQVVNASIISLPLPLMVFLWGTLSLPRPTKTFWVTLIAYTQAIVLIKCIFQYKLIWANYINLPNEPLAPAKIFGVELNPNYASYDLLLLLVLFFHRFILKSHGLWKSEYKFPRGVAKIDSRTQPENPDELQSSVSRINTIEYLEGEAASNNTPGSADGVRRRSKKDRRSENNEENGGNEKKENGNDNRKEGGAESENNKQIVKATATDEVEPRSDRSSVVSSNTYQRRLKHLKRAKYLSSVRKFFSNLLSKSRLPADVYALMFLCDFINFFVLLFGFTAFGSQQSDSAGGVQTYLEENKVPIPFLIMLLVQFMLIVIDRALYLRKALLHKIIFHFLSVIGIHIWMFFIVPAVTERSFYSLAPPIIFYIIKCFYILLSSYQIKCGYPKRILGNFLTKSFSLINMLSFKVYMAIPFLYELRTILDWVCTDSTMTLFDWLKMEDIFADIYFIKCSRQMETDFPAIRATKKPILTKLIMGGLFIIAIVIALWGPLCIFALGNAVGQSNTPLQVSISIRIGSYAPIYQTNTRDNIIAFDEAMYSDMKGAYDKDRAAITFLSSYDATDIAAIKLPGNSPSLWNISPPDRMRLLEELKQNGTIVASFAYSITRIPPDKSLMGTVSDEIIFQMNETFAWREDLINMLETNGTSKVVPLPDLVPKFVKILNSGDVSIVHQLMPVGQTYRPLLLRMRTSSSARIWWEIADFCEDKFHEDILKKLPLDKCNSGIVIYTFNDKKFPSTFSFITKGGILGVYTTFVIVASRFFKSFIGGQNRKIMFEDMPYVDRVLQLCLDIYLVREALEFALEEDLFAKLIFLYRSPETMIKWTRPKEEADDETDSESMRSRASGRAPR